VVRGRVLVGDGAAARAGISKGQKLSTALGLLPGLAVFERDGAREAQALNHLACWAGRFTPTVSLILPAGLLLEIGGCLRLFGGVEAIVQAVLAGCAEQAYSPHWSVAPTPQGARWLAQADSGSIQPTLPAMQAALSALPCCVTDWPDDVLKRLDAFGLKCLGDVRALPTASLRQRLGNLPLDDLQRAWGELPDLQKPFVFPEVFSSRIELPARVEQAEGLAFAAQRLFAALAGWLHGRQFLVHRCSLHLTHDDGSVSVLKLGFAEPAADEVRFMRLLREHLSHLKLSAPVEILTLQADELLDRPGVSESLFEQPLTGEGALVCLARLQARLGEGAVQVLAEKADYRPECATLQRAPAADLKAAEPLTATFAHQRPLWLLPAPQALAERAGSPHWQGPLKLWSRAERLESGWWDQGESDAAGDQRRDYFVARNPQGQWAWIFRNAEGWFLHGLFA
jgi:protein ImuB